MKNVKIGKIGLIVFLTLLTIPIVRSLGITGAIPSDLRMMRGDTAEFKFQVQAVSSASDISCTLYTQDFEPLIFNFKENPIVVTAGTSKYVYGTIRVPNDADIKTYYGKIFSKCSPIMESEEIYGSVITQTMGTKFNLAVVATEAERKIRPITKETPTEEIPEISTSVVITILIIIIAVLVVGVYYWIGRSRKGKKKK